MWMPLLVLSLAQSGVNQESFVAEEFDAHGIGGMTYLFEAPERFRSVGFWWNGDLEGAEVSLFGNNGEIGPWWPLELAGDLNLEVEGLAGDAQVSALVHGRFAQQKGLLLRLGSQHQVAQLSILWIGVTLQSRPGGSLASTAKPPVFDRASWGANPAVCNPAYCTTTHVAMHHTASASEYTSQSWSECAANVKASQVYHMVTRGWCDIGYNYLICPHGDIFEGRGGGDDVRGAHDGYNCGSMGVSMMGYFHAPHNQTLTTAMQDAFVDLAAWKCDQQGIDPLGTSWYAGYGANQTNLYGHRDVSSTACPGDFAYAELPQLRQRVEQRIQGGGGGGIILDNSLASFTGGWTTGTSSPDKFGVDYRWASTGVATARALWNPNIPLAGNYQISLWWPAGSNRNPATQVGLLLNGQLFSGQVNQQLQGGQWNVLGTVALPAGANATIGLTNQGALGWVVVADALR
ncbi:MAG: N-acetylmuramoyl-L-alanine amidase, partial [Planctomycetota bacterium]|nr:N-acetylmuramoyl-L-alanine amidase [Planctomycetota bacterium]